MSEGQSVISGQVVIVGGGVAGLEALLALRALVGDRVAVTLVSQDDWFVDRPVTVAEPFGLGSAARYSLPEIAAELDARFVHATVEAVAASEHRVSCAGGPDLGFDTLILAPGARTRPPFADSIAFGLAGSGQAVKDMLSQLRSGEVRSVAFVAPSLAGWLLPLYELALMTGRELARSEVEGAQLRLVTPEDRPLTLFGDQGSESVGRLLAAAGIEFNGATRATVQGGDVTLGATGEAVAVDCVVTLPLMLGPGLAGVPARQPDGFIPVDEYGRVEGLADVYAAGDAVDFSVKQGGLAAQQADAVAAHVARRHGARVDVAPFRPVLRGMLFTGGEPRFLRSGVPGADPHLPGAWYPLWWPPAKIAGRYLAPYLLERSEVEGFGRPDEGFIDLDIPLTAATLPG
ncbi:MAG TPA: FAD/NAD(P)-binding oxidoreductase [Thermoleophilaceae bacterium]|nr:FAD/NAD(P)-binding oxidoreductase [Thermoleophilaceae bacterium]